MTVRNKFEDHWMEEVRGIFDEDKFFVDSEITQPDGSVILKLHPYADGYELTIHVEEYYLHWQRAGA